MMKPGEKIRSLRKQKNISQEILVNALGVSHQAVSQLKLAQKVIDAFSENFLETRWFMSTGYEYSCERKKEIERLRNE